MTDRTQFEAMLEALINEDQETAKEIFHNIVVAKSREIYEELLDSDFNLQEGENPFASKEGEEEEEESADDSEADDSEADDSEDDSEEGDVGGDASDDFIDDVTDDEGEESEEGEGDVETRVMDLEDALEELKAEFEQLMAGEEDEPEHADMFGGEEEPAGDEFGDEPEMDMGAPEEEDEMAKFMEYVDKVALPKHGDNGNNTRSIVAGKNDMGGTTANIARGGSEKGVEANKGQLKGNGVFKGNKPALQDGGNVNVPGANAGKTAFKKKEPGHGAEKKGSGDTAPDKKSLIGSRK